MRLLTAKLSTKVVLTIPLLAAGAYVAIPPAEGCACGSPKSYRAALKSDLSNLVGWQESFFADSGRDTPDLAPISFSASTGSMVRMEAVTARGWRASARWGDDSLPSGSVGVCVMWVGDLSLATSGVPEGEPLCLRPRRKLWRYGSYGPPAWQR